MIGKLPLILTALAFSGVLSAGDAFLDPIPESPLLWRVVDPAEEQKYVADYSTLNFNDLTIYYNFSEDLRTIKILSPYSPITEFDYFFELKDEIIDGSESLPEHCAHLIKITGKEKCMIRMRRNGKQLVAKIDWENGTLESIPNEEFIFRNRQSLFNMSQEN